MDIDENNRKFNYPVAVSLVVLHATAFAAVAYWCVFGFYTISWILFGIRTIGNGLGVTLGYHRYLTHGSFTCMNKVVTYGMVYWGGLLQNAKSWVSNHLAHHAYSDKTGDPHTPLDGIWHAHMGWLFWKYTAPKRFFNGVLTKAPVIQWENKWHVPIVASGFVIPFVLGGLYGVLYDGQAGFFVYGVDAFLTAVFSTVFVLQFTCSINSFGHIVGWRTHGRRSLLTPIQALPIFLWKIASFGEANHKDHHDHPGSARIGRLDPAWLVILFFEKVGIFTDVHRPPPKQI